MIDFTGDDLRALRRGLALNNETFAKHLGLKAKFLRKAERLEKEKIPIEGEFRVLYDKLCYASSRMIMIRLQYMQNVQQVLQAVATKLEKADKWLSFEERKTKEAEEEETTPVAVEEEEAYEKDDRRVLRSGGVDKRSTLTVDDDEDD